MQENVSYICTKCKKSNDLVNMSLDSSRKNGISSWCKDCRSSSTRKWYSQNTERISKKSKETYEKQYSYEKTRDYTLKARYGISQIEYDLMLINQNNSCNICKKSIKDISYHLHVDHCHTSNKVRGLLCAPCNVYLGYTKDNPEIYKNAITYLKQKEVNVKK